MTLRIFDLQVWVAKARERQIRNTGRKGMATTYYPLSSRRTNIPGLDSTILYILHDSILTPLNPSSSHPPETSTLRSPLTPTSNPPGVTTVQPSVDPHRTRHSELTSHTQQPESSPNHTATLRHSITKILYWPTKGT